MVPAVVNFCMLQPELTRHSTASGSPFCQGIFFPGVQATGYYCVSSSLSTFQTFLTTYSNQLPTPVFTTKTYTTTYLSTIRSSTSTTTTPTTSPTANPTTAGGPSPTGNSITTTSAVSASNDTGSSTPVGAIAGGTVGGVAVLAGLAALIFILLRRKRKNAATAAETTPYAPAPQMTGDPSTGYAYPPTGGQQPQPYGPDRSSYGGQTAYGGSQMTTPQGGYYAVPTAAGGYLSPEQKNFPQQPDLAEADGNSTQPYGSSPAQTYGSPAQSYNGPYSPGPQTAYSPPQGTNDLAHPPGQYAAEKSAEPVGGAAEMSGAAVPGYPQPQGGPPAATVHEMSGFSHQAGPVGEIYEAPGHEHR
jgi:hypothetical protein